MKCEIITTTITTTTRVLPIMTGIVFVPSSNLPSFGNHHRHHGHQNQHHHRHHEHHQHYHNTLTIKSSSLSSAVLPSSNQCCHQSVCPFLSLFSWEATSWFLLVHSPSLLHNIIITNITNIANITIITIIIIIIPLIITITILFLILPSTLTKFFLPLDFFFKIGQNKICFGTANTFRKTHKGAISHQIMVVGPRLQKFGIAGIFR